MAEAVRPRSNLDVHEVAVACRQFEIAVTQAADTQIAIAREAAEQAVRIAQQAAAAIVKDYMIRVEELEREVAQRLTPIAAAVRVLIYLLRERHLLMPLGRIRAHSTSESR